MTSMRYHIDGHEHAIWLFVVIAEGKGTDTVGPHLDFLISAARKRITAADGETAGETG